MSDRCCTDTRFRVYLFPSSVIALYRDRNGNGNTSDPSCWKDGFTFGNLFFDSPAVRYCTTVADRATLP